MNRMKLTLGLLLLLVAQVAYGQVGDRGPAHGPGRAAGQSIAAAGQATVNGLQAHLEGVTRDSPDHATVFSRDGQWKAEISAFHRVYPFYEVFGVSVKTFRWEFVPTWFLWWPTGGYWDWVERRVPALGTRADFYMAGTGVYAYSGYDRQENASYAAALAWHTIPGALGFGSVSGRGWANIGRETLQADVRFGR